MSLLQRKKSFLHNGNLNVWQRGISFTNMANGTRIFDRWEYLKQNTVLMDLAQSSDVPTAKQSGVNTLQSALFSVATADGSASNSLAYINHVIEGYNIQYLFGNWFTFSFWIKASLTGTFAVLFANSGGTPDAAYTTSITINAANTWEKKVVTVPPYVSGAQWLFDTGIGLNVYFFFAAGTSYQTATLNKWRSVSGLNWLAPATQTNGVASTSNTFRIAQMKLELGQYATPLEPLQITDDLKLCKRYYHKLTAGGAGGKLFLPHGKASSTTNVDIFLPFPVPMRSQPTVAVSAASDFRLLDTAGGTFTPSAIGSGSGDYDYDTNNVVGTSGMVVSFTASGLTNNAIYIPVINTSGGWLAIDGDF